MNKSYPQIQIVLGDNPRLIIKQRGTTRDCLAGLSDPDAIKVFKTLCESQGTSLTYDQLHNKIFGEERRDQGDKRITDAVERLRKLFEQLSREGIPVQLDDTEKRYMWGASFVVDDLNNKSDELLFEIKKLGRSSILVRWTEHENVLVQSDHSLKQEASHFVEKLPIAQALYKAIKSAGVTKEYGELRDANLFEMIGDLHTQVQATLSKKEKVEKLIPRLFWGACGLMAIVLCVFFFIRMHPIGTAQSVGNEKDIESRMSEGERPLFLSSSSIYSGAMKSYESALDKNEPNLWIQALTDYRNAWEQSEQPPLPEALIYLENALVRKAAVSDPTMHVRKIAVIVPPHSAGQIMEGVAQAQFEVNEALGHQLNLSAQSAISNTSIENKSGGTDFNSLLNQKKNWGLLVEIVKVDESKDGDATLVAKYLATPSSNVLGVIGHFGSKATLEAMSVYEPENLVCISPTSTLDNLARPGGWFYRTVPDNSIIIDALVRTILALF